jgi:hypothetical protein
MDFLSFLEILESKTARAPKKSGSNYMSCCPAHDDENPSLSVKEESDGKILLKCFAGCRIDAICASLGLEVSDLFASDFSANSSPIRTIYSYKDEEGRELYRKVRIEPGNDGKAKNFYSEHVDENGQVIRSLQGCRRVLYRLPEILKGIAEGNTVYLVEGEKDADKLAGYGLLATTSSESLKWTDEFTEVLKGADVVILYDMDVTGLARRDLLCKALHSKVKRLRVVDLPGLEYRESHGPDVSDWLAQGHQTAELVEITARTIDYTPSSKSGKIRAVTMDEFLLMELPKRELILAPFLPSQGLCLLYAKRGVGKTHVALGIAYAVATGGAFLKWHAPRPRKVIYIDGEMPAAAMQERLKRISVTEYLKLPYPSYLRLITPDLQEGAMPDLSIKEEREILEELIQDSDLIIIDNVSTLFRSGIENEAESWQPVQDWALELRRRGKSVLFVHHAAKAGQQRGTSKREDILDSVIMLKQPQGYCPDQGAMFEVHFEKTRHFAGDDATPFQVRLKEQDDGLWKWEIEEPKTDAEIEKVVAAIKEGMTIEQTIQRTGLSKSQVETRKKKAKEQGLI